MLKKSFLFLFMVCMVITPLVNAESISNHQNFSSPGTANVSSDTYYFITIDPIGNHSVSDVFFINGTTNLPVGDTLLGKGSFYDFVPGRRWGSDISVPVSVLPGITGVPSYSPKLQKEINDEIAEKISTKEVIANEIIGREKLLSEDLLKTNDDNATKITTNRIVVKTKDNTKISNKDSDILVE